MWEPTHGLGESSFRNSISAELRTRRQRVRAPVTLLRSLSDKYSWERYDPPTLSPPSYRLNVISVVLLQWCLWHYIIHMGWYAIKQIDLTKLNQTYTWTHRCWLTNKDLHSSTLFGHWMSSTGLMARDSYENPCYRYDLMLIWRKLLLLPYISCYIKKINPTIYKSLYFSSNFLLLHFPIISSSESRITPWVWYVRCDQFSERTTGTYTWSKTEITPGWCDDCHTGIILLWCNGESTAAGLEA